MATKEALTLREWSGSRPPNGEGDPFWLLAGKQAYNNPSGSGPFICSDRQAIPMFG
jgi:hypothetical protein